MGILPAVAGNTTGLFTTASRGVNTTPPVRPPLQVQRILNKAKARYWAIPLTERPRLDHASYVFTHDEMNQLGALRYSVFPMPRRLSNWFRIPPIEQRQRRRRTTRRVEAIVRRLLANELGDAVRYIVRQELRGSVRR